MKYPAVCNWVSYSKAENGTYIIYDEAFGDTYRMSPREFDFFRRLDGRTDPYKIPSELTQAQRCRMLAYLEQDLLIRKSQILSASLGKALITLFSTENCGLSNKRAATVADKLLSALWLPVLFTSVIYLIKHNEAITGPDCIISGAVFGLIVGMAVHELAHAVACLHHGGKVFEFGVGFQILPCAYVLLNMDDIKSQQKRAHVNAAGVEANLLLTGVGFYLACVLPGVGGFLFFAAIHNAILALLNLIFVKDIDGMGIISEYIGCENLFQYAKETIADRERRKKLCHSGINGVVTLGVCYIALFMQIGLPLLVAFNLVILFV